VLKEIEVQQGILVERAQNIYSFSHLTFHEYLTAKWIAENLSIDLEDQRVALTPKRTFLEDLKTTAQNLFIQKSINRELAVNADNRTHINGNIRQLVDSYLLDEKWREIFLLVAGLAPGRKGADDLLLAIEEKAASFLGKDRLRNLVGWATTITYKTPNDAKPSSKIAALALALALALNSARAFERARPFESVRARPLDSAPASPFDLDSVIVHARALDSALDLDSAPERARALVNALNSASDLDSARVLGSVRPLDLDSDFLIDLDSAGSPLM
jgi:hypothetical protein